jgi:hypothetical protein
MPRSSVAASGLAGGGVGCGGSIGSLVAPTIGAGFGGGGGGSSSTGSDSITGSSFWFPKTTTSSTRQRSCAAGHRTRPA